ncbi:MAG: hypothetical protein M5U19_12730 [Microthrixaceae bacterium]|nr:hypothetical protein [Microthrixaceae bacterium]
MSSIRLCTCRRWLLPPESSRPTPERSTFSITQSGEHLADGTLTAAAPVGGTGSDLAATLSAAVASADGCGDFASASDAMSRGAAAAAVGRGGRSLANFLAGMGEALANADRIDGTRFALGLEAGAERLAPRDDGRHPGGFASVASAAADAALDSVDRGSDLGEAILAAAGAGIEELERGPVLDATLAERGTVDSAAAGLLLVLDALAGVVTGEPLPEPPGVSVDSIAARRTVHDAAPTDFEGTPYGPVRYEVGCELIADDHGIEAEAELEVRLTELCDHHHLERMPGIGWSLEVITASAGPVVETLAGFGRMREVRVELQRSGAGSASREPQLGVAG